jgi:RNA polymerase sigma-70 factor, ECF subfamily
VGDDAQEPAGAPAVEPAPAPLPRDGGGGEPDGRFDAFARREWRQLVAFAWTLTGDVGAAEDLAQDALSAAWQRWDRVGGYDKPGAWARRVVANRAAGRSRRAGRERRAFGRWLGREATGSLGLEPGDDRFWAAVRRLPDRQAQAVALHYLEDRSIADIAAQLGCAEATVKVHLHRGRLTLARTLGLLEGDER